MMSLLRQPSPVAGIFFLNSYKKHFLRLYANQQREKKPKPEVIAAFASSPEWKPQSTKALGKLINEICSSRNSRDHRC